MKLVPAMALNCLAFFMLMSCLPPSNAHLRELRIGALLEIKTNLTMAKIRNATVDLAISNIKNDWSFPIFYYIGDSGCSGQQSIGELAKLKYSSQVNAVIGPSCDDGCVTSGHLATYHNITMVSHSCFSSKLSQKNIYPTFGRVRAYATASPLATTEALIKFFNTMKWKRIGMIHSTEDSWSAAANTIKNELVNANFSIPFHRDYIAGHATSSADSCMLAVKASSVRIIVLIASADATMKLAQAAKSHGLYNGKYVFISLDLYTWESNRAMPSWLKKYPEDLLAGWFDISSKSLTATKSSFLSHLQLRLLNNPFYVQVKEADFPQEVFYLYDAVTAFSLALKQAINDKYIEHVTQYIYNNITNTPNLLVSANITNFTINDVISGIWPGNSSQFEELRNLTSSFFNFTLLNETFDASKVLKDGRYVAQRLFNIDFAATDGKIVVEGVSGRVKMNERGNRYPVLFVRNFLSWKTPLEVVTFDSATKAYRSLATNYTFPSLSKALPPDRATCGFMDDPCTGISSSASTSAVLIGIIVPIIGLIVLLVLYRKYKKRKFENDIFNNKRSFLPYSDLIFQRSTINTNFKTSFSADDDIGSLQNESLTEKEHNSNDNLRSASQQNGFVALYKHQNVFVKRLAKRTVHLDRDVLLEIKLARDIHHSNVNPYLGVVVESPRVCLVSPYCAKGSLRDILANEDITLDWVFRLSFTTDIVLGMSEIHDAIGPMGNLTSYNVLVDRRWTCRISDYGLDRFKEPNPIYMPTLSEDESYKRLLWKAPELLSLTVNKKSKQGDVYGFGIILSEIITRTLPYENYGYPPKDVIHFVQRRCLPPFRPHVRLQTGLDGRMLDVMRRCWHEFPAERPTFNELRKRLKTIIKDRQDSENLVDNMLEMMEKYTNHLERRVRERTEQLQGEKEKVESLLYTLLPKTVAQRLKMGELIPPESFQSVSLMLADIVDFSSITSASTPMQIIDVLNDVAKIFDTVIERLDAFKFDNYNEKFSIVSGCPKKNGIRHVRNIAMFALKVMSKMTIFRMRHRPHELLRLRICCHCGTVVGGLIGMKTPKYSVYGEAVSFLSHLEATGPPLRIQISPDFKEKLNDVGGFETILRGPVKVKGRGLVVAHFLTGKEGMDFDLPEPEQDKGLALNDLGSTTRKMSRASSTKPPFEIHGGQPSVS